MDELLQQLIHFLQMFGGFAVRVFQLTLVFRQQGAAGVEIVGIGLMVKGQGIELAAEGFCLAQITTLFAQMCASVFNAEVLVNSGFRLCQRDF